MRLCIVALPLQRSVRLTHPPLSPTPLLFFPFLLSFSESRHLFLSSSFVSKKLIKPIRPGNRSDLSIKVVGANFRSNLDREA